jgi:hypothetical protein
MIDRPLPPNQVIVATQRCNGFQEPGGGTTPEKTQSDGYQPQQKGGNIMRSKDKGKFKMTRRQVLKAGMIAGAGLMMPGNSMLLRNAFGVTPQPPVPLPGSAIPQFVDELPVLGTGMVLATATDLTIKMQEFQADMMPSTFMPDTYNGTWVWGYQTDGIPTPLAPNGALATYINPVVVATRHVPTKITWVNELPTGALSNTYWEDWTDLTLHWAHPNGEILNEHYRGSIPAVPHLHGGAAVTPRSTTTPTPRRPPRYGSTTTLWASRASTFTPASPGLTCCSTPVIPGPSTRPGSSRSSSRTACSTPTGSSSSRTRASTPSTPSGCPSSRAT